MSEIIERVARAICASLDEDPDAADTPYEIRGWRLHQSTARAAIAAMREPTEAMIGAGGDIIWTRVNNDQNGINAHAIEAWCAMIDEALR